MFRLLLAFTLALPTVVQSHQVLAPGEAIQRAYRVIEPSLLGGERVLHNIILPEGDWLISRVINYEASIVRGDFQKIPMRSISLAQVDKNNRLLMGIFIRTNISSRQIKWNDDPCKGSDFLFMTTFETRFWNQKCLSISLAGFLQQNNSAQNLSREFYIQRGIQYSANTLRASITRFDDRGKYLGVEIYLFPENYGFENPTESVLARHPWHSSLYKSDSKKVKFLKAYSAWAESYANVLFKMFDDPSNMPSAMKGFEYE